MESIILRRTGDVPLAFEGDLLAESNGRVQAGRDHSRWHVLGVYRTKGGTYVVRIAYRTQYQGEMDHDLAMPVADATEVVAELRLYNPTECVRGFPPHESFYERQAKLMDDIDHRYRRQIADLLSEHPEFAEVIP